MCDSCRRWPIYPWQTSPRPYCGSERCAWCGSLVDVTEAESTDYFGEIRFYCPSCYREHEADVEFRETEGRAEMDEIGGER